MAKKQTKKEPPELKVIFDTNALYTQVASDLFNHEVAELIKKNSNHSDLKITWCLPDVVMHERQYQMQTKGFELFPSIQKLERLLGDSIGVNKEIIKERVGAAIEKHIKDYNIEVVNLNTGNVDFQRMMLDAAYRNPPFDVGDKEKGFRDALIAETFMQIVSSSPTTPKICRVALVSNDKLLREAVKDRTNHLANVRFLSSLGELESLISTLISEVTEEFVERIKEKAERYFFTRDDTATLYYKEKIVAAIDRKFRPELDALPKRANFRTNGDFHTEAPRFVKKKGQRVFWASRILVEARAYEYLHSKSPRETSCLFEIRGSQVPPTFRSKWSLLERIGISEFGTGALAVMPFGDEELVAKGESVFEVIWSVSVSERRQRFSSPNIESIRFIETSWDDAP